MVTDEPARRPSRRHGVNGAHAAEALLHVGVGLLPGTTPETVAQRLADAVVHLPVLAAAVIGTHPMPADIAAQARALGEQQGLAAAAEEQGVLFARIWFQPSEVLSAEAETVAIALVERFGKSTSKASPPA